MASLRALLFFTVVAGVLYPAFVTVIAGTLFPGAATGSLLYRDGRITGSSLLAPKPGGPRYFQPRPSGGDFATFPSAATSAGPTSAALREVVEKRRQELGPDAPADLLTTSGSGVDPHVSPASARYQIPRVAKARGLSDDQSSKLARLVDERTEGRTFGILGEPRVNVVELNQMLDERFP